MPARLGLGDGARDLPQDQQDHQTNGRLRSGGVGQLTAGQRTTGVRKRGRCFGGMLWGALKGWDVCCGGGLSEDKEQKMQNYTAYQIGCSFLGESSGIGLGETD